jgi:hypothetical protein
VGHFEEERRLIAAMPITPPANIKQTQESAPRFYGAADGTASVLHV